MTRLRQARRPPTTRPEPSPRAERPRARGPLNAVGVYFTRHLQVFFGSLGRLSRAPLGTLLTSAVLGIALALPFGLSVLLQNAQQLSSGWDGATQISLFLKSELSEARGRAFHERLRERADVAEVQFIPREEALAEFQRLSGFGDILTALEDNPLPSVIVVRPSLAHAAPGAVEKLVRQLGAYPEVDSAQLDMQWVKRLYAIMDILQRGVQVLALLLALAVVLVVGNTIRLAIQNQRDEIVITKLIGGTDRFIRRPFLYTGFWYGVFGALIAYVLISTTLLALREPVQVLSGLYNSGFRLSNLDAGTSALLLVAGVVLGLLGSWLAVSRHLREIEPT